ncbi:hypothetical protein ES705_02907 [subsurface metagenome]
MSTRCQIEFMNISTIEVKKGPGKGKLIKEVERRTVYRHSDGYPESVIPDLKEFLEWNKGRNNDIECQAANFIYWSKKRQKKQIERHIVSVNYADFPKAKKQWLLAGFGICNNDEFHSDIAFYYEVISDSETKEITIKCYSVDYPVPEKKEDFKLISAEKVKI